jgi:hypothetical protein
VVSVILLAMSLPSLAAAAGPYPQTRQGWLVGFGVGGGSAAISVGSATSDREAGGAGTFRVGYAFQPQLSLELDANTWTKTENSVTLSFSVATAAINYYPGASGLVLRGGIGSGSADATILVGSHSFKGSESGLGLTFGAAYEFRVTRTFAIGPQLDYSLAKFSDFDSNHMIGSLGFNWYFIPK